MFEHGFLHAANRLLFLALAGASPAGLPLSIGAEPEPLAQPALASPRASASVLLAVTQAGKRLLAVGERGIVLFSDDGARSWRQAKVPVSVSLTNVRFVTEQKGWAVGHAGVVLRTDDGGANWTKQFDGRQAAAAMLRAAEQAALSGPDDEPQRDETQRQLKEARRSLAEGPDKPFFDLAFLDEQRGFIVGAHGLFFMTPDGGKTWLPWQGRINNPTGKHLYGIAALGTSLYVAGEEGALYRSTDGGQSFVETKTPYRGSYFGIVHPAKDSVMVFGLRGNAYCSTNAGQHWHKIGGGTLATYTAALALTDGSFAMVSQAGDVLHSAGQACNFRPLTVPHRFPFSGVVQNGKHELLVSGVRGITRVALTQARP